MGGTVLLLAAVTMGVDVGWQRLPGGGLEYIIQIEPHVLKTLGTGEDIVSDIPPNLRGVRSYRITVGTAVLPREGELEAGPPAPAHSEATPWSVGPAPSAKPPAINERAASLPLEAPREFTPPAMVNPLSEAREKAVAYVQAEVAEPNTTVPEHSGEDWGQGDGIETPPGESEGEPEEAPPPKPWFLLVLGWTLFSGSSAGMLYSGWIAWDYRRRYRTLLHRIHGVDQETLTSGEASSSSGD